jgi:addiction module HigA family antidote
MLREEFLKPMELAQRDLAAAIDVPDQYVNDIVDERRRVTRSAALRLAQYLGTTSEFWRNGQMRRDLYHARQEEKRGFK